MPTETPPALDAVRFFTVIALAIFDREFALVVGPYAVIIIGSTAGAGWALSAMAPMSRTRGVLFFMRTIATAMLISVTLSILLAEYLGVDDPNLLLGAVALFIGSIGDRWPRLWHWALGLLTTVVERTAGARGPKRKDDDEGAAP